MELQQFKSTTTDKPNYDFTKFNCQHENDSKRLTDDSGVVIAWFSHKFKRILLYSNAFKKETTHTHIQKGNKICLTKFVFVFNTKRDNEKSSVTTTGVSDKKSGLHFLSLFGTFLTFLTFLERKCYELRSIAGEVYPESYILQHKSRPLQCRVIVYLQCFQELQCVSVIWRC